MLFLNRAGLVILSQPKTGTTALENALTPRSSISISKPPELKHMSYRGFMAYMAPMIEAHTRMKRSDYEVISVMREPLDWLGSWYRYRTRDELKKPDNPRSVNYTGGMTFDQFVRDVCRPVGEQPVHARIKTPSWVSLSGMNAIGVDRLYPYENLSDLYQLIIDRTGKPIDAKLANVSPEMPLSLTNDTKAVLRRAFAFEFELHESLRRDGAINERFKRQAADIDTTDLSPGV
ncbi:gamma-glutamyl kinase [Rhizobium sp. TH2]|uniref:hypothetical protein n=1 Tax=Rhizobium sp. TH2 TaxID=2775403 RepID=UPI0021581436|nr:hypothetical protein [Rhizobium sp. TH2]UVC11309.1 gamma-glutamyl kinase [Rhizobium sp. TH2]